MEKYLSIYKPQGLTPLQLIQKVKSVYPQYQKIKIGFAGRLDPLAHGVILLLLGEENKNRDNYLGLNKSYNFSVLFGIQTDSYDYLGLLKSLDISTPPSNLETRIKKFIKSHRGVITQTYPPFSSKTINGTQLYKLAKKNQIKDNDLPKRQVEIFDFRLLDIQTVNSKVIKKEITQNLRKIKGHFRQTRIKQKWRIFFILHPDQDFVLANFSLDCSSGTYVRSLANKMGQEFGCSAIAFEILRTAVGDFNIERSRKISD